MLVWSPERTAERTTVCPWSARSSTVLRSSPTMGSAICFVAPCLDAAVTRTLIGSPPLASVPAPPGSRQVPECLVHGLVMPSSGRTRVASRALRRSAAAMLRWPCCRRMPRWRGCAGWPWRGGGAGAELPGVLGEGDSRMWCSASMPQWPRIQSASAPISLPSAGRVESRGWIQGCAVAATRLSGPLAPATQPGCWRRGTVWRIARWPLRSQSGDSPTTRRSWCGLSVRSRRWPGSRTPTSPPLPLSSVVAASSLPSWSTAPAFVPCWLPAARCPRLGRAGSLPRCATRWWPPILRGSSTVTSPQRMSC
jgi:hypothetical protein